VARPPVHPRDAPLKRCVHETALAWGPVATYLVRVALADRPGALGAVASRIGSVRADVIAVEIVERRRGSALDEFVVELADENRLSLLLSEIAEVDGASVEAVRPITGRAHDRRLDAYHTAEALLEARTPQTVLTALAGRICTELDAAWTAVVDVEGGLTVASHGRPPPAARLAALVAEARGNGGAAADAARDGDAEDPEGAEGGASPAGTLDIGWVDLAAWDLVLVAGRPGWRFGPREQAHLAAVARLADARWVDLAAEHEVGTTAPSPRRSGGPRPEGAPGNQAP